MSCSYISLSKSDEKLSAENTITGGALAPALSVGTITALADNRFSWNPNPFDFQAAESESI